MKKGKNGCDVNSCFLCRLSSKEWIPAIAAHRKNFAFKKGDILFKEGDVVTGIYFVFQGNVKVHKKWGEDKELILRFARKGAILGHRGLGLDLHYPVSATALESGIVCFIDIEFFNATWKVNPDFSYNLMMFFAEELKLSERKMRDLAHMPVKGRVAQAFVMLKEQFGLNEGGCLDIQLSRQDLASFTGATYETLFRVMNELVEVGAIELRGKGIFLKDQNVLECFARPL